MSAAPTQHPANRLAGETSLYLKQHAHNPVDWFPWGPEALQKAKELGKPIFLSVGYSACHWCHVMAHESFEDEATARVMNAHFVCVKVDREERPDLDTIYMNALQVLTREGGGWPLSVFLTPDLTPFFAGTYYPPDDRYAGHGRPSFKRLLAGIADAWENRRDHVAEVGRNVAAYLRDTATFDADNGPLTDDLLKAATSALRGTFDATHGGFGHAPKFPHALELKLLLRVAKRFNDDTALRMVKLTLDKMARGGIYDQLGGGFHRYSVDGHWLVPHFEKMLYDNALLTTAYVEAFQLTRDPFYEQVARETCEYVLRELTSPVGAFYSTQDADSEGEEGKFSVWSDAEFTSTLGPELADIASRTWDVTVGGNFEGHNILHRTRTDAEEAKRFGLGVEAFRARLDDARAKLLAVRGGRVWPGRDEKLLTAWNGLMIAAFAQAGAALDEPRYVEAARRAADHVLTHLRGANGRLFRTAGVDQPAKLNGYLEDYAFLADALVTLYEATFEPHWLRAALDLADLVVKHFADPAGPGFFYTADDHEELIARTKDLHDGSTPSGNAMAVTALLRLAVLCDRRDLAATAEAALRGYRGLMADAPAASGQMLVALDFYLGPVAEVAVVGPAGHADTVAVFRAVRAGFRPNQVVAAPDPATGEPPADLIPLLKDKPQVGGAVTTYVCRDYACEAPLVGADAAVKAFA